MSFKAEPMKKGGNYYSIKEGTFRLRSSKEDPEAVRREYTNPKTNEDGVAYERVFKSLYGTITDVSFRDNTLSDGTMLRSMNVSLGKDENGIEHIVSIPSDSRYTTDFLKRLPKINLSKEVRLTPYDFENEGPRQVGISVAQQDGEGKFTEKADNQFFTKVEEKDGEKVYTNLHGFPEATEEDRSDWPFYFKKVNKFLVKYAQENIRPKLLPKITERFEEDGLDELDEQVPY